MGKNRFYLVAFAVLFFIAISETLSFAQTKGDEQMIEKIKNVKSCVVKIICSDISSLGSGFVITKDGYIITSFHVVGAINVDKQLNKISPRYSNDIQIRFNNGEQVKADVAVDNTDLRPIIFDYCILKIQKTDLNYLSLGGFGNVEEGSTIYFCGYPFGKNFLTTHKGMISSKHVIESQFNVNGRNIKYKILQIDGSINKGNSGGPLLAYDNNNVIGIVSMREGSITQGLQEVRNFIEEGSKRSTGGVYLSGVNPIPVLKELIDVLDTYISVGIGFAVSIEYAENHLKEIIAGKK